MTTGFVLAGGASLGAVQVGMLRALQEAGIKPDLYVGASVGAINAAWMAVRGADARDLGGIWAGLRRSDVFPLKPWHIGLAAFGGRQHLLSPSALTRLIRQHLPYRRLEQAATPVHVVTTDVTTGEELLLSQGDALTALLASCAIPGIFPPVRWQRRWLVDGGVTNNTPISHAVALGATEIYVLPAGYACDLDMPPGSALAMALHAVSIAIQRRLIDDVRGCAGRVRLHVVPALCPVRVLPIDFSHSAELIERARRQTERWLATGSRSLDPAAELRFNLPHHTVTAVTRLPRRTHARIPT